MTQNAERSDAVTQSERYTIDPLHSRLGFRVAYFGIGHVDGRFDGYSGSILYDPARPEATRALIEVQSATIETGIADRDRFLRSSAFLNSEAFPVIQFKSKAMQAHEADQFDVEGELTLHGVSRPIRLLATILAVEDEGGRRERLTLHTSCSIDRHDFNLGWEALPEMVDGLVGSRVHLEFEMSARLLAPEGVRAAE